MKFLKKLACVGFALALAGTMGSVYTASAETNAEGWEKREDGYFYEVNPPIRDLFDFHESAEDNGQTACDFYVCDYTGSLTGTTVQVTQRSLLSYENNVIPAGDALIAQYDWGPGYCKQGACWHPENTNYTGRYMDFTFKVDFTSLNKGCGVFQYIHDNIIISFQLNDDQIIVQEKESANKFSYKYADSEVYFIDCEGLSALTGKQRITVLIEDRVENDTSEITRANNKGALVTVKVGEDIEVKQMIQHCGYYAGIFGIFNNMNTDLILDTAKSDLVKENISNYLDESKYNASVWATLKQIRDEAIVGVDEQNAGDLDEYYEQVIETLDKYPTAAEEILKAEKQEEVFAEISENYVENEYVAETWTGLNALIEDYKGKIEVAFKAGEVEALYEEFLMKSESYFSIADTEEQSRLIAEIRTYGEGKEFASADLSEIKEIRAEYILEMEQAPSIWDVRMLCLAAKADIDSFENKTLEDKPQSSSSASQKSDEGGSGCGSVLSANVGVIVCIALGLGSVTLRCKKRKD